MDIVRRRLQRATSEERDALKEIMEAESSSNDALIAALQKQ